MLLVVVVVVGRRAVVCGGVRGGLAQTDGWPGTPGWLGRWGGVVLVGRQAGR